MINLSENVEKFQSEIKGTDCKLVAVSKTKPVELLQEAYDLGVRIFGENKVQELADKHEQLPKDIEWHMIGHLQRNKVKYITPFVSLIHAVDSERLLKEINKRSAFDGRVTNCLLQVHIAQEETKFGFDEQELQSLMNKETMKQFPNIKLKGVMGMATNTPNQTQVREEFRGLRQLFERLKSATVGIENIDLTEVSMGMSNDYKIAIEEGSTMIRIGSSIFGARNYV